LENFTAEDFRRVLTAQHLKELQIIYLALGFGIFVFTVVLFFIYNAISEVVTPQDPTQIMLLSMVHFALLLICFPVSKYLFDNTVRGKWVLKITSPSTGDADQAVPKEPAEIFWNRLRTAHIIRLALFEGVALFGLLVCALAMFDGIMQSYPVCWINLLSSFVFGMIVMSKFPTVEKLERFFREYVQGQIYQMPDQNY
jgi:hypothetical protein